MKIEIYSSSFEYRPALLTYFDVCLDDLKLKRLIEETDEGANAWRGRIGLASLMLGHTSRRPNYINIR